MAYCTGEKSFGVVPLSHPNSSGKKYAVLRPSGLSSRADTALSERCLATCVFQSSLQGKSLPWRPQYARRKRVYLRAPPASTAAAPPLPGENNPGAEFSVTVAKLRGFLFYLWTFTLALPLFVIMMIQAPFVALFDRKRRLAQHFVNDVWAKLSTRLFYRVQVNGRENLPAADEPVVYIANHQSFLDIFTLFHLNRPFKFISKTSIFFIPIVGWSMFMTGHVRLNRMDRRSQLACLAECRELLQQGASVLFFPEGTRATDMRLQEFKKGAFSVAAKAEVPVVPISLVGTGRKMPNKQESRMFPGNVEMFIHPRVSPKSADKMLLEARKAVLSGLPRNMHPPLG